MIAIRIDRVEGLSDSEKSDSFGILDSIMNATGCSSEAAEMQNRADELFQAAKKRDGSEEQERVSILRKYDNPVDERGIHCASSQA